MYTRSNAIKKFDFEIGYLIKSPCKDCHMHSLNFPACTDHCESLNEIQNILAPGITCTQSHSSPETSLLSLQGWNES
jgi:hypothetical protein